MKIQRTEITESQRKLLSDFMCEHISIKVNFSIVIAIWARLAWVIKWHKMALMHFRMRMQQAVDVGNCSMAVNVLREAIEWYNEKLVVVFEEIC